MRGVVWASALILLLCSGVPGVFCASDREDIPGIYGVASNHCQLAISVMDMRRYDTEQAVWVTLGLVVENRQNRTASVGPESFRVLDSNGDTIPASEDYPLKNPFEHRDVGPGGVVVGSLSFKLEAGARPVMLEDQGTGLKIRLDKATKPPGTSHSPGVLVDEGGSIVGIEGISRSEDGRALRVDYLLKNSGPGIMLLEPRDYGRFGVLIDVSGWSYSACDYKMIGPAVPPGGTVEGYMAYEVPDGSNPRYLLFWPPDEDAVLFDLNSGQ